MEMQGSQYKMDVFYCKEWRNKTISYWSLLHINLVNYRKKAPIAGELESHVDICM